ncbi:MAG TPA: YfhO family protein, partial [Anaeromyxobacter sp.]
GALAQLTLDAGSEDGTWSLVRSEGIRPRAFVAPRWRWSPLEAALAETVGASRPADPGLVLLAGSGPPSPPANAALPLEPCDLVSYRPERVELSCTSPAGGFAVLAEENAPGWTATVDGAPARVERADVLLRAVAVGPGVHRVVFAYRTPLLRLGVLVSVLAWIAWVAVGRRHRSAVHGGGAP